MELPTIPPYLTNDHIGVRSYSLDVEDMRLGSVLTLKILYKRSWPEITPSSRDNSVGNHIMVNNFSLGVSRLGTRREVRL